jgi:hypothetical protein
MHDGRLLTLEETVTFRKNMRGNSSILPIRHYLAEFGSEFRKPDAVVAGGFSGSDGFWPSFGFGCERPVRCGPGWPVRLGRDAWIGGGGGF